MTTRTRFLSKVIVRNLPLGLDEGAFRALVGEKVLENVDYFYYVQGKAKPKKVDVQSRAYLNFTNQTALLDFSAQFDGHVFLDNKGNSLACSVEYAQSQLKPKKMGVGGGGKRAPKVDPLVGTIESDEKFQQFLAELAAPVAAPSSEIEPIAPRGLTPLLAAIKEKDQKKYQEKVARKERKKKVKKAAAIPAKPTVAAAPKRKKNKKVKKNGEPGPQYGAVKILGAASSAPSSSSSLPASSDTSDPKKKRRRRPRANKTAADSQSKPTPPKT
jgi:hypothetical protein